MARRNNPDTTTLALLAGGAALVFLLGRKKTDAPAAQPPPPSETIVAVEEPVSIVAQGEVAVQQPPVVSIPESTPVLENTGTVSLSSGGAPAVLLLNDQRTNYDVPSVPAAVQVKLPVGQVILRLQYADGTQSVRRPVVVVQGLTKEVVIMSPIPTRNAGGVGSNPTGNIQVIAPDAGLLVVNGTVSSKVVPAAPRTLIFSYQPQNGRYDISLQIKYPDGVLSEKASVRVVSGQTVNVSIPPRLYSNRPQGLINLNPQSLSAFNPSLVAGRLSAVGTAVNNKTDSGTGTLLVTTDAACTVRVLGAQTMRLPLAAGERRSVDLSQGQATVDCQFADGTMAPARAVTIVSGQTQMLTFKKPSGLTLGNGLSLFGLGAKLSASGGGGGDVSAADIQRFYLGQSSAAAQSSGALWAAALQQAADDRVAAAAVPATLYAASNVDGTVTYLTASRTIGGRRTMEDSLPAQTLDVRFTTRNDRSKTERVTLVAGRTTKLYFVVSPYGQITATESID